MPTYLRATTLAVAELIGWARHKLVLQFDSADGALVGLAEKPATDRKLDFSGGKGGGDQRMLVLRPASAPSAHFNHHEPTRNR